MRHHGGPGPVTSGFLIDVYPDEEGWVDQGDRRCPEALPWLSVIEPHNCDIDSRWRGCAAVSPNSYLVRFDFFGKEKVPMPMEIVAVTEMTAVVNHGADCDCRTRVFQFFDTRKEMDEWLNWINTPSEPTKKVVHLGLVDTKH